MLKRFLFAVLLTLLLCVPAFAMKNEPGGFGGIKWGDKLSQHPDLVPSENGMGYIRPNDRMQIQLSNVSHVLYAFDEHEGFYQVFVYFPLFSNIEQILLECLELWDEHDAVEIEKNDDNSDDMSVRWNGRQVTVELWINDVDSDTYVPILSIKDNDRWQRRKSRNEQR